MEEEERKKKKKKINEFHLVMISYIRGILA